MIKRSNLLYIACPQGDSGSPLVIDKKTVIGIASSGNVQCSEKIFPTVYTRVTSFIPFIENVMNNVLTSDMRIHTYAF